MTEPSLVTRLRAFKEQKRPIVMLTAYDYPTARFLDGSGVDVILVGDSVGTNVLGLSDVSQVTIDHMVHHTAAVSRGTSRAVVLSDMPYGSFGDEPSAVTHAGMLLEAGADAIKMEGEGAVIDRIAACTRNGIAVCAHIGYTPQSQGAHARVQGKDPARAKQLLTEAKRAEDAGACMLVLELVPVELSGLISSRLAIPTIGIGAGPSCDGQVQVVHDILGMSEKIFRHAKAYSHMSSEIARAVGQYTDEVKNALFPTCDNALSLDEDLWTEIQRQIDE